MADFVVGASLKANRTGSLGNAGTLVTTPIPFSGLRSVSCGAQSGFNGLYLPINQFEYSFYNDFTVECFLRGDGTTNDGGFLNFNVQNGLNTPGQLNFMIDGDELQLNNYEFPGTGYRKKIGADIGTRTTTDWYHFACVRKDNKYSLFWNGDRVAYDVDSAGNGTADTIDIDSDDAYLFEPFGGNYGINQGRLPSVLLGSGGNKPSDQSGSFHWGGYIANYRTSYIAQYDPSSSTYTVPSAAFSNFSGTTTYYKDSTNNNLYNESDNLPTTFNDLVLENASLGDVTVEAVPTVEALPTGVSASTSLGDLVPENEVIGVSLRSTTNASQKNATRNSTTIPFSGVASWELLTTANETFFETPLQSGTPSVYFSYNDFTIEMFIRGDGTNRGGAFIDWEIENDAGSNPGDNSRANLFATWDTSGATEKIKILNQNYDGNVFKVLFSSDIPATDATSWYHVALTRKNNKYSLFWNGNRIAYDIDSSGNGTADVISINSDDAYLFAPIGGNKTFPYRSRRIRFGGAQTSFGQILPANIGFVANMRTSYIAQYDPDDPTLTIPNGAFELDASGQDFYYKDALTTVNDSTTLPITFNDLVLENASLGSVTVNLEVDIDATAQTLSLSYNPATGLPKQDIDVTGFSQTLSLGTTTDKQGYDVFGSLLQAREGTADVDIELPVPVTGQNLTALLGTAAAGPGILVPSTGQNLTISLGDINLPVSWGNVTTGTTSTWTPVDTGDKAIGP